MKTLPARLVPAHDDPRRPDRIVAVADRGAEVLVRWRLAPRVDAWRWRCGDCGPQNVASCPHAFAAALCLAEQLLGVTPVTDATPNREETAR